MSNDDNNSINISQKQSKSFDNIYKDTKKDKTNNKIKKIYNKTKSNKLKSNSSPNNIKNLIKYIM